MSHYLTLCFRAAPELQLRPRVHTRSGVHRQQHTVQEREALLLQIRIHGGRKCVQQWVVTIALITLPSNIKMVVNIWLKLIAAIIVIVDIYQCCETRKLHFVSQGVSDLHPREKTLKHNNTHYQETPGVKFKP